MAQSKSITQLRQLQKNATPEVAVSFTVEPIVADGVLTPGYARANPGVFTAGTMVEASSSNPNNDSNA